MFNFLFIYFQPPCTIFYFLFIHFQHPPNTFHILFIYFQPPSTMFQSLKDGASKIGQNIKEGAEAAKEKTLNTIDKHRVVLVGIDKQSMSRWWSLSQWLYWHHIIKLTTVTAIIGSDNGLSPVRHQTLIGTNDRLLLIGPGKQTLIKFESKCDEFHRRKCIWNRRL